MLASQNEIKMGNYRSKALGITEGVDSLKKSVAERINNRVF